MACPIIFDDGGERFVFSGNTRMDIAFQLGINPKALLINSVISFAFKALSLAKIKASI
jgi:hypothetical protein